MQSKTIGHSKAKVLTGGMVDVFKDGMLTKDTPTSSILVSSQSDLANLEGITAGSIAFTAGFTNIWQLSPTGTWVEV